MAAQRQEPAKQNLGRMSKFLREKISIILVFRSRARCHYWLAAGVLKQAYAHTKMMKELSSRSILRRRRQRRAAPRHWAQGATYYLHLRCNVQWVCRVAAATAVAATAAVCQRNLTLFTDRFPSTMFAEISSLYYIIVTSLVPHLRLRPPPLTHFSCHWLKFVLPAAPHMADQVTRGNWCRVGRSNGRSVS